MNVPVILGVLIALAMLAAVGVMAYDTFQRPRPADPPAPPAGPPANPPAAGDRPPPAHRTASAEGTPPPHARA